MGRDPEIGRGVDVAADGYTELDGYVMFSVLADATAEKRGQVHVVGLPLTGTTVDFLVARFPMSEVARVAGGWPCAGFLAQPRSEPILNALPKLTVGNQSSAVSPGCSRG